VQDRVLPDWSGVKGPWALPGSSRQRRSVKPFSDRLDHVCAIMADQRARSESVRAPV